MTPVSLVGDFQAGLPLPGRLPGSLLRPTVAPFLMAIDRQTPGKLSLTMRSARSNSEIALSADRRETPRDWARSL